MYILFFFSIGMILYVYVGYPLMVAGFAIILNRRVRRSEITPTVTVLIAAYNEKAFIETTIRNKLNQDYPEELLDIIVVSDGSMDGTDEIINKLQNPRVQLMRQEPRAGKTSALNLAVKKARGEIIVFSDANSYYAPDALRQLVANFSDPDVGYVSGKLIYANQDGGSIGDGCTAYMKYENVLRWLETCIGSVVGSDGGIDSVRRELYVFMNPDQLPDFVLPLHVIKKGFRVVYEPKSLLWEECLKKSGEEYRMRVRVSLRAFWALFDMRNLLIFRKNLLYSWQLWSHKVLRYICCIFLISTFVTNIFLLNKGMIFQIVFLLQIISYLLAIFSPILEKKGIEFKIISFLRYFFLINIAAGHALIKFLMGKKQVLWVPRKG